MESRSEEEWMRLVRKFAETSSMQGLPRAILAKSRFGRMFWLVLFLAGLAAFLWSASDSVTKYLSYPVKQTTYFSNENIPLPTMTLCYSRCLDDEIYNTMANITASANDSELRQRVENPAHYQFVTDYLRYTEKYKGKLKLDVPCRKCLLSNNGIESVSNAKLELNELPMRFGCAAGKQEKVDDGFRPPCKVESFFDPRQGSCLTISGKSELLFTEQHNSGLLTYIKFAKYPSKAHSSKFFQDFIEIYPHDGAIVTVSPDSKREYGVQLDNGFRVLPGTMVEIGVRVKRFERLAAPYSTCADNYTADYDFARCEGECLQKQLIETCGCKSIDLVSWNDERYKNVTFCDHISDLYDICEANDTTGYSYYINECINRHYGCAYYVMTQMNVSNCDCLPPCQETKYDLSVIVYPLPDIEDFVTYIVQDIESAYYWDFNAKKLNGTLSVIRVYLQDKYVMVIEEQPDYSLSQLLGDFGGQIGLFIGLSLLSFGEVLEFLVRLARVSHAVRRHRRALRTARKSGDFTGLPGMLDEHF